MSFVNKRKRDASEPESKKTKALIGEKEKELYTLSEEWPVYNHPEGGTIKITPWGSLRQCVDAQTGETITKFEDASFSDLTFPAANVGAFGRQNWQSGQNIAGAQGNPYYELPSTPMSLNMSGSSRSSPVPDKVSFSPSCEAELYVVDGYRYSGFNGAAGQAVGQQFSQEQENFFGMEEQEEFSDNNDSMML
ncbi:CIC11C00000004856 [Sungouiella intermedia]|uniref:CIC11C00000004856 n=1 Tax=Sungouiella intermedia TaxID=45354 RepID=A0A1L0BZY6_9ASCO|nr:CIC11C00000004856 [[Candida] intermedia]